MSGQIINADAVNGLKRLADKSVHTCITSPPYYGLRDYGVEGQIGLERTPKDYISRLTAIFLEVKRVLRDDGTLWVNIADSYAGSGKGGATNPENVAKCKQVTNRGMLGASAVKGIRWGDCKPKDLVGVPWMLAFALRDIGYYWRDTIIWAKQNPMPESVKDRCTKAHEYILLFSKSKKYYFDSEAIKEPCVGFNNSLPAGSVNTLTPNSRRRKGNAKTFRGGGAYTNNRTYYNSAVVERESHGNAENLTGLRNKRSVWTVSTKKYKSAHFATFPEELITPCVLAGSPEGGVVLDTFGGSGTTGAVAVKQNRGYILIDINPHYCELAKRRIADETPPPTLFDFLEAIK